MKFVSQLSTIFADLDADVLARQTKWALERVAAVRALRNELSPKRREMGEHAYYSRLFNEAGGKTWYTVLIERNAAQIEEFVAKNVAATAAMRNAKISTKLEKAGATTLDGSDHATSRDGFHGVFFIDTDAGRKRVEIDTIVAGGYNIQCLHQRTLVKVK